MKKLWLDIEMSGDIDDAVMLIFALEHKLNVKAVSLLNPTDSELSFVKYWLEYFNQDIALFVHNTTQFHKRNETHKIISEFQNIDYPVFKLCEITEIDGYTVVGGGAYTIPLLLSQMGFNNFVLQGGFAGANICKEPVLEKFRNKTECSSWNPNLDIASTKTLMGQRWIPIEFISKDICHDSSIDIDFVSKMKEGETKNFLLKYFENHNKPKKMHDLVALLYSIDNSFIKMLPIEMSEKNGKWKSSYSEFSSKKISVNWDKNHFLGLLAANN